MAPQAPQASRQAAPPAAKAAAVTTCVYAACFGLPAISVAVYLLQTRQLPWLFDAFPVDGGPWSNSAQPEPLAAQLGAFLVLMLAVSWGGWLLWRGWRAGAVLTVATIPLEALFWYGFALPFAPLLALIRVVLVIAAWPRLRRRRVAACETRCRDPRGGFGKTVERPARRTGATPRGPRPPGSIVWGGDTNGPPGRNPPGLLGSGRSTSLGEERTGHAKSPRAGSSTAP